MNKQTERDALYWPKRKGSPFAGVFGPKAHVAAVTSTAAWQCHSEDVIGSLEPGKLADFVILDDDPRSVQPAAISDITVSETWMDGRQVFEA